MCVLKTIERWIAAHGGAAIRRRFDLYATLGSDLDEYSDNNERNLTDSAILAPFSRHHFAWEAIECTHLNCHGPPRQTVGTAQSLIKKDRGRNVCPETVGHTTRLGFADSILRPISGILRPMLRIPCEMCCVGSSIVSATVIVSFIDIAMVIAERLGMLGQPFRVVQHLAFIHARVKGCPTPPSPWEGGSTHVPDASAARSCAW
jgi:hypothetical protein